MPKMKMGRGNGNGCRPRPNPDCTSTKARANLTRKLSQIENHLQATRPDRTRLDPIPISTNCVYVCVCVSCQTDRLRGVSCRSDVIRGRAYSGRTLSLLERVPKVCVRNGAPRNY